MESLDKTSGTLELLEYRAETRKADDSKLELHAMRIYNEQERNAMTVSIQGLFWNLLQQGIITYNEFESTMVQISHEKVSIPLHYWDMARLLQPIVADPIRLYFITGYFFQQ